MCFIGWPAFLAIFEKVKGPISYCFEKSCKCVCNKIDSMRTWFGILSMIIMGFGCNPDPDINMDSDPFPVLCYI